MTNLEYLISVLCGEVDDGGASYEAVVHYNIACPHFLGERNLRCENRSPCREICVTCKMEWLEQEVSE